MAQPHVTSHPVQPRQWLRGQRIEPPPRHQKRLGSDLIRRLPASTARGIGVYRAIRVLIQCREALGASGGHGAHATLIIEPPPNLSGRPEKTVTRSQLSPPGPHTLIATAAMVSS